MEGFENTKFANILSRAKEVVKGKGVEIASIALKASTGNISGAISDTISILRKDNTSESNDLLNELEIRRQEIENELFRLEIEDAKNARDNETQRDISPNSSFLSKNIHEIIALVVVGSWIVSWWVSPKGFSSDDIFKAVFLILGYLYGRTKPQQ